MNRTRLRILLFIVLIGGILALVRFTPIWSYVNFSELFNKKDVLIDFVRGRYALSIAIFMAAYVVTVAASIPGGAVLTILGGFLFGPLLGTLYINISATIGAAAIFSVTRHILGNTLQTRYADRLARFNGELEKNGTNYMITARLVPAFPFFLINILAGLTSLPLRTFVWTTMLGIIPGTFVYAYLGYAGASLDSLQLSPEIVVALALLAVLSIVPVAVRKIKSRNKASGGKIEKTNS